MQASSSLIPTLSLSYSDEDPVAAPALPSTELPLERKTLGALQAFPTDVILLCLANLSAFHLLKFGRVNRACYQLSQTSCLWQKLVITVCPLVLSSLPETNWKMCYRQHERYERNFILFRKRACSKVTSLRPTCQRWNRAGAFILMMKKYYFSFDLQGNLRAICDDNTCQRIYNIHGKIEKIIREDWQVEAYIHKEFIELAAVDGNYPFPPEVQFQIISPLNVEQQQAVHYLQCRTLDWLTRMAQASDLDQRVKEALRSSHASKISCVRGGDELVTSSHKAYFIFFQVLLETPLLQQLTQESSPPLKRARSTNPSPDD
jgi:hypothetical protein